MNATDYNSYLNYRIALKAKYAGRPDKISIDNPENENDKFYVRFRNEAEKEIDLLNKSGIKPVKTSPPLPPALPQFLHIYDPFNVSIKIEPNDNCLFLTSSRYKNARIYKPEAAGLKYLEGYCGNFDFICAGTNSEAEIDFIKKFSGNSPMLILPAYSLINLKHTDGFDFKNSLIISALDPFSKVSKYGFALRNDLAFHLSREMAVLYLSEKSSLSSVIKKFEDAGKPVKILEREHAAKPDGQPGADIACIKKERDYIQEFIINSLEKENIAIDNLLKLSNIKLNVNDKETMKAVSMLEMNSEIERRPGGIIKKI